MPDPEIEKVRRKIFEVYPDLLELMRENIQIPPSRAEKFASESVYFEKALKLSRLMMSDEKQVMQSAVDRV